MRYILLLIALMFFASSTFGQNHQIVTTWTASPTTGVLGYNMYKLTGVCPTNPTLAAFGPKLASTTATVLTYTDIAVTSGTTYCYVVTAFTNGGESGFAGTWQATVPIFTVSNSPASPGPIGGTAQ
jgi:hypothetical protein